MELWKHLQDHKGLKPTSKCLHVVEITIQEYAKINTEINCILKKNNSILHGNSKSNWLHWATIGYIGLTE